jgi:hypothetical protein
VELELPPEPPLEVEVEPPVEVDDTMMLPPDPLLPLLPPPKKPPAKKPPLKPPPVELLPPTKTGISPPPLLPKLAAANWGGRGAGANGMGPGICVTVRVVTAAAAGATVHTVRRVVRRTTRRTVRWEAAAATRVLPLWITAGRSGGFSRTCTAPPPMMAPPAAQAHNFANAIRTDITILFSRPPAGLVMPRPWGV